LRADASHHLLHTLDHQWYRLPLAEQTPMSAWNRTPLQALINTGVPADTAVGVAFAVWLLCVVITLWRAHGVQLPFPLAFALSFVLLNWGRPILWTLIYWELVLVVAAWPFLQRRGRILLLSAVAVLMTSHWLALARTLGSYGLPLFTLQSADFPWETWLVMPLSWLLLLSTMARCTRWQGRLAHPCLQRFL